jgi:hypothetical protein
MRNNLILSAFVFTVFSLSVSGANESHEGAHEHEVAPAHEETPAPDHESAPVDYTEMRIIDSPEEIKVPISLWNLLSEEARPTLIFVPVAVILTEKNPGVLKQSPVKIVFPRGGGAVDLAQFINNKQGSFYVKFEFEQDSPKEAQGFIFFVSQARKRKIDGEVFGSGCKKFMDIHKGLALASKSQGILVNTTRSRHLSVLGGNFIFASVLRKEIRLAQVSFKDSSHPEYFCGSLSEGNKSEHVESL